MIAVGWSEPSPPLPPFPPPRLTEMLKIDVITLFPEAIAPYLGASIPGRAAAEGLVRFNLVQLRQFTQDRHQTVDDYGYGGGGGGGLKAEPVFAGGGKTRPPPVALCA